MRKASMILGIVGGVIAVLIAILAIGGGALFRVAYPEIIESSIDEESDYYENADYEESLGVAGFVFMGVGSVILIAGILGIVGGAIVKKHNIAGGVLMFIGSVISLFTVWAIISFIILLLGGIFAVVKDNYTNSNQGEVMMNNPLE